MGLSSENGHNHCGGTAELKQLEKLFSIVALAESVEAVTPLRERLGMDGFCLLRYHGYHKVA